MSLIIYNRSNRIAFCAEPTEELKCNRRTMVENTMEITFTTSSNEELKAGDYIIFEGDKFVAAENVRPKKIGEYEYITSSIFYGIERSLKQVLMTDVTKGVTNTNFSFKGSITEHVAKLVEVLSRLGITITLGEIIKTQKRTTINYSGVTCFEAATLIANAYNVEWWFYGGWFHMTKPRESERPFVMTLKGKVAPESNIPYLICGGEVNAAGDLILSCGSDCFARKSSTGHYIITLPDYMRGKDNYSVMLTPVLSDNRVTRAGIDVSANCFWVQAWQSPGRFEDSGFTFMVYGSGPRID